MTKLNNRRSILEILQSRLDNKYGRGIFKAAKILLLFGCMSVFTSCVSDGRAYSTNEGGNIPSTTEGTNTPRGTTAGSGAKIIIERTGQTANPELPFDTDEPFVIDAFFAKKLETKSSDKSDEKKTEEKPRYKEIKEANIGETVYVFVDTINLNGKKVDISILDKEGHLTKGVKMDKVPFKDSNKGVFSGTVGDDNFAVFEVCLRHKEKDADGDLTKEWKKICRKQKAQFAIKAEVIGVENVIYCGLNDNKDKETNIWLNQEGLWFNIKHAIIIAPWIEIAKKEIGVNENDMNYGYDRVKEYTRDGVGYPMNPKKTAWCSGFANWVLIETNKTKGTDYSYIPTTNGNIYNPAMAINFVNKARYSGGVIIPATKKPPYGAILIIKKTTNSEGHATFVINYTEESDGFTIVGLGGNQFDEVRTLSYKFTKKGNQYIYNNKFNHLGYVLPKEYEYDETDQDYYAYENVTAPSATGSNLR